MNIKCSKCNKSITIPRVYDFSNPIICNNCGNKIEYTKRFKAIYKILDFSLYILIFIIFHYMSKYIKFYININNSIIRYIISYCLSGFVSICLYIFISSCIYKLLIIFKFKFNI